MAQVTISEAEWQVMNLLWEREPLAAQDVIDAVAEPNGWSPSTVKTMLHRLVKKGVLTFDKSGKSYVYRSRVARTDCVQNESQSFLQRVFEGEHANLVAYFLRDTQFNADEIAQLRRILDEQEAQ
ncbi:MAG: BlaI/MecI/CopY family transcriptional regulator [Planctomycetaceae bacterium]|nr:BlaI/MecI/CopY family transcriptional regulator [Planctomycetaceae bacterium]